MVLFDSYGRPLTNVRLMVTWRCNFNCFFCHREGYGVERGDELTVEEVSIISEAAARLGIRYFKVTGGEPLVRNDIVEIVKAIHEYGGRPYISITTNGSLLSRYAPLLAGYLNHVNVSVHSLKRERFRKITGVDALESVLKGLRAAVDNGLRLKINVVVLKGLNEDEIEDFIELAGKLNARLQLIELHPVGEGKKAFSSYHVPYTEVVRMLEARASKVRFRLGLHSRPIFVLDNGVEVEVVGPVGNFVFCSACTRVRVTFDGKLLPCLNWRAQPPVDLRSMVSMARSWEEKVLKAIDAFKLVNKFRRPGYMWSRFYTSPPPHRFKLYRLGLPKSDGRLVFTGPRADELLRRLLEMWDPLLES